MKTKINIKPKLQSYVWDYENGRVHKDDGVAVVVRAKSIGDAIPKFPQMEGCGGYVRLAGDEPRIEAIYRFAEAWYQLGRLDKELADLEQKRRDLSSEAEDLRLTAYALPASVAEFDEGIPF